MFNEAERTETGVGLVHAHEGKDDVPGLSPTDRRTAEEILAHFGLLLPEYAHAYIVVNATHVAWQRWSSAAVSPGRRASAGRVESHASRVRCKLAAAGLDGWVVNVWGVGYKLRPSDA